MKSWINNNSRKAGKAMSSFIKNDANTKLLIGGLGVMSAKTAMSATNFTKRKSEEILTMLHPENMLPTGRGRFGKRTDNLEQSSMQGIRFNFKR